MDQPWMCLQTSTTSKLNSKKIESGAGAKLDAFLKEAKVKYDTGMGEFVWKPSLSIMEFAELRLIKESMRLQLFTNMSSHL
jgi:phytoene desaturase